MAYCSAISCINKENKLDDFIFKTGYAKTGFTIDFNLVDYLNESNKKVIQLSSMAFNQTKDVKTLQLLLKIKRDHQKMDAELKKMTEKNLIILPKLSYAFNLNPDSLKGKNANSYLSKELEKEIKNQVMVLDRIEKTVENIDFKTLAVKSKKTVQANYEILKTLNMKYVKQSKYCIG